MALGNRDADTVPHARLFGADGAFGRDIISRTENECSVDVFRARGGQGARAKPQPIVRELSQHERIEEGGWLVTVAPVNHFAPHLISYGYRIDCDGQSIVYSGDTDPSRALAKLAADCDVLVHMCHYLPGTALSPTFAAFTSGHLEAPGRHRRHGPRASSFLMLRNSSIGPVCAKGSSPT